MAKAWKFKKIDPRKQKTQQLTAADDQGAVLERCLVPWDTDLSGGGEMQTLYFGLGSFLSRMLVSGQCYSQKQALLVKEKGYTCFLSNTTGMSLIFVIKWKKKNPSVA